MNLVVQNTVIAEVEKKLANPFSKSEKMVIRALATTIHDESSREALARTMTDDSVMMSQLWESRSDRYTFWKNYIDMVFKDGVDYLKRLESYDISE